jgi:tRNA(His) 5'-end guanylyltransferase
MNDDMGDRIKEYESISKIRMTKRVPVIIRCDGKSFSNFCKRFELPYDIYFNTYMNNVMKHLCANIQGAKMAERHSDEISILVTDYDNINTDSYFDYQVQKICSIVSSMATAEFCRQLMLKDIVIEKYMYMYSGTDSVDMEVPNKIFLTTDESFPTFDCRCFNIPESEISNYFYWRLKDAVRNSINMTAQSKFSHKQLQGVSCNQMQDMLFKEHNLNWNDLPSGQKTGFICLKKKVNSEIPDGPYKGVLFERNSWIVDPAPSQLQDLRDIVYSIFGKE